MENIAKAIQEFNGFKYKYEEIKTRSQWNGGWEHEEAVLLIYAEFSPSDKDIKKLHVHYDECHGGSVRFNKWLEKYNFNFDWENSCVAYIWLNKPQTNSLIIERVYPVREAFTAKMKVKKSKIVKKSIIDFEIVDEIVEILN